MNPVFSPWFESSSLSKAFLFLSFHNVQKRHNGAASHTFFHFLPTKEPWHPSKVAFTEDNTTQETLKRDNKSPHSHNVEKCDQLTPIQQDKENIYLLIPILFSRADQELVLFPKAPPRQKIHALGGTHGFQTTHIGKGTDLLSWRKV